MWQEARKQEKKIRGLMVDYKKRAERRREFYEKIKLDPAQFVRAYGRPCKINLDPAVAYAAESPQSMMPWQGQTDNMIDRFDVRAHLDYMPQTKIVAPPTLSKREEEEERWCNYERYRIIVENECAGMTEEQALYQIYIDEQFGNVDKTRDEEKKKLEGKKAAIGFVYEDSTPLPLKDEDSDSSDTDVENVDLDITLDVDTLNNEQKRLLNECAEQYSMKQDDFVSMLQKDKEEAEALKLARILEEEKAQFAGRKSRRERRAYKEKKLAGRTLSPPSYAARDSPKYEPYNKSSSSSKSRSRSPERQGKLLFITSFGGDSDDDRTIQGPSLPPNNDKPDKWNKRSRDNKHKKKQRRRSRSGSSSSRSRSNDKRKREKLKKRNNKCRTKYKGRKYSDSSSHSSSFNKSRDSSSRSRSKSKSRSKSRSRSISRSRSRSRSYSSKSRSSSFSSRSGSKSPVKVAPPIKRYRRDSLSSKASDSESDHKSSYHSRRDGRDGQEHSRHDRGQRSKTETKTAGKSTSIAPQVKLTPQEKLRRKMQAALGKTFKADKKAEVERTIKSEQERIDREEELRLRALEMRRREREKRHRDIGDSSSDDSSRSRSPISSISSPSDSKRRRRSRSRSRERDRERERTSRTDYR